ncbi:MAG: hypothetical protein IH991_07245 [Planctomycetes bacterium]|nr:hypothetical protein [Planctomycetota bacterium]
MLGRLLSNTKTIEWLTASKRLDLILDVAIDEENEAARQQMYQYLCSNTTVNALVTHDHFDGFFKLISDVPDAAKRASLLAQLLSNNSTIEYLSGKKKIGLVLELVGNLKDDRARSSFLTRILYSPTIVSAIIENKQFGELVKACRAEPIAKSRRQLLAKLLFTRPAVDQLASTNQLKSVFQDVLDEPDKNARRDIVASWLARSDCVGALIGQGLFDTLYTIADTEQDGIRRREMLGNLLTSSTGIEEAIAKKKVGVLIDIVAEEANSTRRRILLQNIINRSKVIAALADAGRFDDLIKTIKEVHPDSSNTSVLRGLLFNRSTFPHFAKGGHIRPFMEQLMVQDINLQRSFTQQLMNSSDGWWVLGEAKLGDELIALLKAEHDVARRQSLVRSAFQNRRLPQRLINTGQAAVLDELIKLEPDEGMRKTHLKSILYAPSGLVAAHIQNGKHDRALQLLEDNADDDLGRLRLATFLLLTEQIEGRITELRKQIDSEPNAPAARLLAYCLRAKGDLDGARAAAKLTDDAGLLKAVMIEQCDWAAAAKVQAAGPSPFPVFARSNRPKTHQQAEHLGLLAAYQRLAGQTEDFEKTIEQILELARSAPEDLSRRWFCVEALLLNDRFEEGIELLAKTYPLRAFDLYTYRHQFQQALNLANWPKEVKPDRAWLDSLPTVGSNEENRVIQRFEFALKVARTLHTLGKHEARDQVIELAEAYAQEQPLGNSPSGPRRACGEKLCIALVRMGQLDRAWKVGAAVLFGSRATPWYFSRLYPQRYREAQGWWMYFRLKYSAEPSSETLARIHRVLYPSSPQAAAEFDDLVDDAEKLALSIQDARRNGLLSTIGTTSMRRGNLETAQRCLVAVDLERSTWLVNHLLGDVYRMREQWADAAKSYKASWERDRDQLRGLYLAGEMLIRAGSDEEGQRLKQQASLMALDSRARSSMTRSLRLAGLDDADEQYELLLRTAPCQHLEWGEAAFNLSDSRLNSSVADAADLLQHTVLDDLLLNYYFRDDRWYLSAPLSVHKRHARAAIAAKDFGRASREIELALVAAPANTQLTEDLLPLLNDAGQGKLAGELFNKLFEGYSKAIQQYPESAVLHNNLAWLSARCGRRLDDALKHATQAVKLAPDNSGHLDTLAEVHFHRGNRENAVRHARRALKLKPLDDNLKKQLKRFQSDPLPKH